VALACASVGLVEGPGRPVPVTRVVDGDTFHVRHSGHDVSVRLIGIDAPEVGWYGGTAECYGNRAGAVAVELLEGRRVRLEHDAERVDRYGRTLAYAYVSGRMVNVTLVRRGLARVTIFRPNDRHEDRLRRAEDAARRTGAGLWSACR
jgi:micrococcal nuclease